MDNLLSPIVQSNRSSLIKRTCLHSPWLCKSFWLKSTSNYHREKRWGDNRQAFPFKWIVWCLWSIIPIDFGQTAVKIQSIQRFSKILTINQLNDDNLCTEEEFTLQRAVNNTKGSHCSLKHVYFRESICIQTQHLLLTVKMICRFYWRNASII